ncbi:MAG: glyceraldehyde-3-phosphate dehydrogenase [Roseivivax sp.]|nr:glyceraldehyde-3-phosphate dehydrogenase [Roseivivax sp.]
MNQYLTFTRTAIELRRLPLAVRIDLDIAGIEDKVAARAVYGR